MVGLKDLPLREIKKAKTKLEILSVLKKKLKNRPLDQINIIEICNDVLISEVTFYNYFKKKNDLILYHNQLLEIELWIFLKTKHSDYSGLRAIEYIFEKISDKFESNSLLMREFLLVLANSRNKPNFQTISTAEILMKFPELKVLPPPNLSIPLLFSEHIIEAIKNGDLKKDIDIQMVLHSLLTILIGLPFSLMFSGQLENMRNTRKIFQNQLNLLWKGLNS